MSARIVAVADAFETYTSEGRNRRPISEEEAIERILAQSGRSYDPQVVEALVRVVVVRREVAAA